MNTVWLCILLFLMSKPAWTNQDYIRRNLEEYTQQHHLEDNQEEEINQEEQPSPLVPQGELDYHLHEDSHEYEQDDSNYFFKYGVNDPHTGDYKQQSERKEGDTVRGEYSLLEPDGTVRTVRYVVDKGSGFDAVVHRAASQ